MLLNKCFIVLKKKEILGVLVGEKNLWNFWYKMIMIDNFKYFFFLEKVWKVLVGFFDRIFVWKNKGFFV